MNTNPKQNEETYISPEIRTIDFTNVPPILEGSSEHGEEGGEHDWPNP